MPETSTASLLVSLDKEATAIIRHFNLKRDVSHHAWPLYHNDRLSLVVSGMGKANAAAACAWLQAQRPAPCWINVGIAGHATADIGSSWLVNKITDSDSSETWYPQTTLLANMPGKPLTCVSKPAGYESEADLYDMEASGFVSTASRFTTLEWIQLIKIVSDNRQQHWQQLDKNRVPELVSHALPVIESVIDTLTRAYPGTHPPCCDKELLTELISTFHFTTTQRNELATLLTRCKTLACCPATDALLAQDNARGVMKLLSESIGSATRNYKIPEHG